MISISGVLNKKAPVFTEAFLVQAERLELSHLAALDPKSSVSTNSTTPAFIFPLQNLFGEGVQI